MQPTPHPLAESERLRCRLQRSRTRQIEPLRQALLDRLASIRQVMTQPFAEPRREPLRLQSEDLLEANDFTRPSAGALVELVLVPPLPLPRLDRPLAQIVEGLEPGGLCMVASLGPGSLDRLRDGLGLSASAVSELLPDMHDLGDLLVRRGLTAPVLESERLSLSYGSIGGLLGDLHALWPWGLLLHEPGASIDASGVSFERPGRGLRGRHHFSALTDRLADLREADGRLVLELEIVLAHAWRGEPRSARPANAPQPVRLVRKNRFADR